MIDDLATELESTADWRSEKAKQYPDDNRNTDAVEICNRLASDLRSSASVKHLKIYHAIHDFVYAEGDDNSDSGYRVAQAWDEYRGRIGFESFPKDASEYLADLLRVAKDAAPEVEYLIPH